MNKKILWAACAALCLAAAGQAFAQHDEHHGRGNEERGQAGPPGRSGDIRRDDREHFQPPGRNDRYDYRPAHENNGRGPRGAGPRHDMYQGRRLPSDYRSRQYVVEDWRTHRLPPPRRGYHWVQAGGDYVLVAIASGIIAQVLLNQ